MVARRQQRTDLLDVVDRRRDDLPSVRALRQR
jgi:hypothetical protein